MLGWHTRICLRHRIPELQLKCNNIIPMIVIIKNENNKDSTSKYHLKCVYHRWFMFRGCISHILRDARAPFLIQEPVALLDGQGFIHKRIAGLIMPKKLQALQASLLLFNLFKLLSSLRWSELLHGRAVRSFDLRFALGANYCVRLGKEATYA